MVNSRKPVVVFVPGLGASGEVYNLLLDRLRQRYDVRSADLPENFPRELDWPFFFDSIDAAAGGARTFRLLGHSMGGSIALKYAAVHPRRVVRTVAVSPVLFPFTSRRKRWKAHLLNPWMAVWHGHLGHMLKATRIIRSRSTGGRAGRLYRFSRSVDLQPDLPKLRGANILWPRHEEIVPRAQFERVRREYSGIMTLDVPGSHHTIALAPEPLVPIIEEALDG